MKRLSAKEAKPGAVRPSRAAWTWRDKTIHELAVEQGVKLPQDPQKLLGAGAELWDSDEELDEFLRAIRERRNATLPAR